MNKSVIAAMRFGVGRRDVPSELNLPSSTAQIKSEPGSIRAAAASSNFAASPYFTRAREESRKGRNRLLRR